MDLGLYRILGLRLDLNLDLGQDLKSGSCDTNSYR